MKSVTVTLVIVPVSPDTLIVEGYGVAAVGPDATVFIVIGVGFEKTTFTESLAVMTDGLRPNNKTRPNTKAEHNNVAQFLTLTEAVLCMVFPQGFEEL